MEPFSPPQHCDVLPCLECVHLAGDRLLRGHLSDGRLRAGEDRDSFRSRLSSRSGLQRPGGGGALRVVGLLAAADVSFDARPGLAVLPHQPRSRRLHRPVVVHP